MQSSTRANLEDNYNYHAALAEYHKQRIEHAGGSGDSVAGAQSESTVEGGASTPAPAPATAPARGSRSAPTQQMAPRDPSVTLSRDQALFELHDETAKQLRSALDNSLKDAPSADSMKADRPVVRRTSRAMARSAAASRTRH